MTDIERLKKLLLGGGEKAVERRAKAVGTTVPYLYKLALGHGTPSLKMAMALCAAVPGLKPAHFHGARVERCKIGRQRPYKPRARKG